MLRSTFHITGTRIRPPCHKYRTAHTCIVHTAHITSNVLAHAHTSGCTVWARWLRSSKGLLAARTHRGTVPARACCTTHTAIRICTDRRQCGLLPTCTQALCDVGGRTGRAEAQPSDAERRATTATICPSERAATAATGPTAARSHRRCGVAAAAELLWPAAWLLLELSEHANRRSVTWRLVVAAVTLRAGSHAAALETQQRSAAAAAPMPPPADTSDRRPPRLL